ncbi:MAG: tRNA (adenine(9)-N1)-methyltransferase Trm10 [Pyrobaculum sp.]
MGVAVLTPISTLFFQYLSKIGVDCVCIPPRFKCWGDLPQCVAVWLLVGRYKLCQDECLGDVAEVCEGVAILKKGGAARCGWRLAKSCEKPREVGFTPPETPRIIIDLSLWHEHTPGERHELVEQILETLRVVRRYLWDGSLWISNAPEEFLQLLDLHARGLVHKMKILGGAPSFEKPVVLDPEGPCLLTEEVAYAYKEFVIGGIVDKERTAKSGTRRLAELLRIETRCRIELRGSKIGVPDRINKIAEIILRTLAGSSLEKAILATQAKRDRVYRLMWEIQRRARRRPDGLLVITREELAEANWMGAPLSEVELALKKTRVVVA